MTHEREAPVEVREARDKRERRAFIELPWWIYRGNDLWVPPLISSMETQLDPRRNPFFEHAEMRLFIARRGGVAVGRIAAIINHLHNSYHKDRRGFWGFFECEDDPEAARALLDRAADELRSRGLTEMLGPFNPSINAECGLLVDNFDKPPAILMPYNPPYYPALVEGAGLRPAKDLLALIVLDEGAGPNAEAGRRLERLGNAVRRRHPEISLRRIRMRDYEAEVVAFGELFNTARRDNWGYVPATDAELRAMAHEMKPILDPNLIVVAEIAGRAVGCMIGLPDVNPVLRKMNGRVWPFGWVHLLLGRRVRRMRVFGAACLPEYRNLGVTALLLDEFIRDGLRRGYTGAELSWIAEDNVKSMGTILSAVEPVYQKRYRVYSREIG